MSEPDPSQSSTTRSRILFEAGPIFADKGFRSTTVREICDKAQVNLASINYYFGDKQQLYTQTVMMAREMRVEKIPYPKWGLDTPAEQKLSTYIRMLLNRLVLKQSEPWQVRLLMREILSPSEPCRQMVREYFRPFLDSLLEIVDALVGHRLDDFDRTRIGLSIIGQCLYYRFASDVTSMIVGEEEYADHFGVDELTQHIAEFSLGAIEKIRRKSGQDNEAIETN